MANAHVAKVLRASNFVVKAEHINDVTSAISAALGVGPDILTKLTFGIVDAAKALKVQHPSFFEDTVAPAQHQNGELDPAFVAYLAASGCTSETFKTFRPEARSTMWWRFKDALQKEKEPAVPTEAERLVKRPLHTLTPEEKLVVGGMTRQKVDNPAVQPVAKVPATAATAKLSPEQKLSYVFARTEALKAHAAWGRAKAHLSSLSPLMQLEASKNIARLESIMKRGGIDPSPQSSQA